MGNEAKIAGHRPAPLVGLAIGDALGAPFEFRPASDPELQAWQGGYRRSQFTGTPGTWTDDTKMARALAESLVECGLFNPEHVASKYVAWYETGDLRGIGVTCASAIRQLREGVPCTASGAKGQYAAGNGTAMRVAPLGLMFANNRTGLLCAAEKDARITHDNHEAVLGSIAVSVGVAELSSGSSKTAREAYEAALTTCEAYDYDAQAGSKFTANLRRARELADDPNVTPAEALKILGTRGYVTHTVASAFFCLLRGQSFEQTVVMAVKGGNDADTTGAVAGALAGALYGLEGIPVELYEALEDNAALRALDAQLADPGSL